MFFTKAKVYYNAVSVTRKPFVNWPELVLKAVSGQVAFSCNSLLI